MGVVYRAQDPKIGRTLAIKSIRLNELTDAQERERLRERLFREAQSAGILSHPNIVTIYDVSEEDGLAYIFMEFVNGMAFDDFLRASPPPTGQSVMELLSQTAIAIDYAHKNGIIHRDIKPANILIHEGTVAKVCDFGVAKIVSQQMTQAGMLMGTPSYMSPEQIEGRLMDGRSDQFALAVMVFDILTGEKPFQGDSLPVLLYKICRAEPPSASSLNTTLGIWVDPVLRKALAKDPGDRYPNCNAFIAELRRALDERPGWMLPGKGFPGEDSTTNSGHAQADTNAPTVAVLPQGSQPQQQQQQPQTSGASDFSATSASSSGSSPNPAFATPAFANPPAPAPPSTDQATSHPIPPAPPVTGTAFRPPQEPSRKGMPMAVYMLAAFLVVGGGIYFGYQAFTGPKPPVEDPAKQGSDPVKPSTGEPGAKGGSGSTSKPEAPSKPADPPKPPKPESGNPSSGGTSSTSGVSLSGVSLSFNGSPAGVTITLDGDSALSCKMPCSLTVPKGRHSLVAALDGYRGQNRVLDVSADASIPVDLAEAVGILVIQTTPPGATIFLNGQERSEKSPAQLRVKPGTYQVTVVSQDGRKLSDSVPVSDGSLKRYVVDFP